MDFVAPQVWATHECHGNIPKIKATRTGAPRGLDTINSTSDRYAIVFEHLVLGDRGDHMVNCFHMGHGGAH